MLMAIGETSQPVGVMTAEESSSYNFDRYKGRFVKGVSAWFPPTNFAKFMNQEWGIFTALDPLFWAGALTPPLIAYMLLRKAGR